MTVKLNIHFIEWFKKKKFLIQNSERGDGLRFFAQISLGGAILFAPFRYRIVLYEFSIPPIYSDYTYVLLFISDIFLLLTLFLWAVSLGVKPRKISLGPKLFFIPLAGLLIVGTISAFFSVNVWLSLYHVIQIFALIGLYLFVVNEFKSMKLLVWAIAGSVLIQTCVGITQILDQSSVGLQVLGELDLNPSLSGISIVWSEGFRSLRAYGLSDHPNILGGVLAFSLIFIMGYYVTSTSSKKVILAGVYMAGFLALFLTFSRAAWVGFTAGMIVLAGLFFRDRRVEALRNGLNLLLASVVLVTPFIWHNAAVLGLGEGSLTGSSANSLSLSNAERQAINRAANEIFQDHALVGVGLGSFPIALKNEKPDFPYDYQPARVVLLNAAVETGIFGGLLYFLLLVMPWLIMWVTRMKMKFRPGLICATGALAATTMVSFYDYYTWLLTPGRFWQWLVWGLWAAYYTISLNRVDND